MEICRNFDRPGAGAGRTFCRPGTLGQPQAAGSAPHISSCPHASQSFAVSECSRQLVGTAFLLLQSPCSPSYLWCCIYIGPDQGTT